VSDAYLILENGAVFKGESFGYDGRAVGELVFSTGMTGYLETLTDPCHYGHIVLQTFPLIGNFGVIRGEFAGWADQDGRAAQLNAYIVREWCQEPSNFRNEGNLDSFLRFNRIPGLCGIDTRALTRVIRENGSMNAMISGSPELSEKEWAMLREYRITGAVEAVAKKRGGDGEDKYRGACMAPGGPEKKFSVALWDFGSRDALVRQLIEHGCDPKLFGYGHSADEILACNPDGVVLTDGPGDPAENTRIIGEIKKLCGKTAPGGADRRSGSGSETTGKNIPIFGVGLGHQMLALANGAKTEKLAFGHRGANHPVRELETGRAFVTKQNHGYTVAADSIPGNAEMNYVNANDGTCEGIAYKDIRALSVQFHPTIEAVGRLLGKFTDMMEGRDANAAE